MEILQNLLKFYAISFITHMTKIKYEVFELQLIRKPQTKNKVTIPQLGI